MDLPNIKLQRKNSMSYFDLLAWIVENRENMINCIIDNIFSIENQENAFIFKLYCNGKDKELLIEAGKRINFTKYNYPKSSYGKASILRELIRGDVIKDVQILEKERILVLYLKSEKKIIVELLPRGLLVIADKENKILFSTEYKEFRDRKIKPGEYYKPPPSIEIPKEEIQKLLKKGNFARALGVPQEVIAYLNLSDQSEIDLDSIRQKIKSLEDSIINKKIEPCIIQNLTVTPFLLSSCKKYENFNDALDDYFYSITQKELEEEYSKQILEQKQKILNTISKLEENIKEYQEKEKLYQKIGNSILLESYQLEQIINERKANEKKIKVNLDGIEVELDTTIPVTKNATIFFDKAKEYKRKLARALESLQELKRKLEESEKQELEKRDEIKILLRKKEWYEKYRWSISRNGFLIIAGKDASQNESIMRKIMEDSDIFLHADIQGAPATILKINQNNQKEEDIFDAAVIAACYSKAWKLGLGSVDVFWVYGNQVSKSPPSGEYLAKGSFMIYGKKNFIKNVKLELSLGLVINDEKISIIVGSEEAVKTKTQYYVVLVPGDDEKEKLADKIIKVFSKQRPNIKGLNILKNDIIDKIPAKGKILKTSITYNS
ncbi:MAG: ribosome rescue protein RqcH [Saccharolobus sp.]